MATEQDVMVGIAQFCAGVLYPNGTAGASVVGFAVKCEAGWPIRQTLDADLRNNVAHISVYALQIEKDKSHLPYPEEMVNYQAPTITASVLGLMITIGGTITAGNIVAIKIDHEYIAAYTVKAPDTLASVASGLAAAINAIGSGYSATVSGPEVTIVGAGYVSVGTGNSGGVLDEVQESDRRFQVSIWANSFGNRDAITRILKPNLAATYRLALTDGTMCTMRYHTAPIYDRDEQANLYRQDIYMDVVYDAVLTSVVPGIVETTVVLTPQPSGV